MRVPIRSFRETAPLYVLILVYQYVIRSTEPRAQAVSTAAAVQASEIFRVLAVFEVLHSLITRRVVVLQYWYSHTSECVAVKRCRYHAIRGSVVCTCGIHTYHTSTDDIPYVCCA